MPKPVQEPLPKPPALRAEDVRGALRLSHEALGGLIDLVESMHAGIADRVLGRSTAADPEDGLRRARGLTGLVYRGVRGISGGVGSATELLLGSLARQLLPASSAAAPHARREALLAALNGVLGDHLADSGNPLAIAMRFRRQGQALPLQAEALRASLAAQTSTPRLLVLLHGLCMNDLQWRLGTAEDHGQVLARELGYTPVYLHYNSGLGIARNGRLLAERLQTLCEAWPQPLERLVLLGHSMGGLVARSAIHHAAQRRGEGDASLSWPQRLDDLVCLGSPHLGAPLERAGHGLERLLAALPYAAPLARLGQIRSAGITDLRLGHITEAASDAQGRRHWNQVPLPGNTRCYAVAASLGPAPHSLKSRLLGDGLVPVASALGRHRDPARGLDFAPERQAVVYRAGHLELLSSPEVLALLRGWLR
ncbi:MAG: esterase/lipase family protein [Roseateles sp.]